MPSCGSKPVLVSANCVSTIAAAQGSSRAITSSGTSSEPASFATLRYWSAPMTLSSVFTLGQRAARGDELDRFERIHVVEVDFHDDAREAW